MKFFIIRHKATGKYMPTGKRAGNTWWEPYLASTKVPRLFYRIGDAKNAKRMWEGGCLERHYTHSDLLFSDGIEDIRYSKTYGLDRKPDDLEILEVVMWTENDPLFNAI